MAIEHALLGLLANRPSHGYELVKEFSQNTVLGDIVHLEPGMLYSHLKKLERYGWVSAQTEEQESRPARRIFHLTDAGREEMDRWLSEPVEKTRDIRLEFLLKLYIARELKPEMVNDLVTEQYQMCQQFIESLQEQLTQEEDDFRSLVLQMRLAQNQALASWLQKSARETLRVEA